MKWTVQLVTLRDVWTTKVKVNYEQFNSSHQTCLQKKQKWILIGHVTNKVYKGMLWLEAFNLAFQRVAEKHDSERRVEGFSLSPFHKSGWVRYRVLWVNPQSGQNTLTSIYVNVPLLYILSCHGINLLKFDLDQDFLI